MAEAGRITGLGSEISSKIILGLQPAYAKKAGLKPMKFVASAGQMADLSKDDPIIVRFSRSDHNTVVGPLPVARFPGRRAGKWTHYPLRVASVHGRGKGALRSSLTYNRGKALSLL